MLFFVKDDADAIRYLKTGVRPEWPFFR